MEYHRPYRSYPEDCPMTDPITYQEMYYAKAGRTAVKAGRTVGMDGIFRDIIEHLGRKATQWLNHTFNNILQRTPYPLIWKHGKVIAILKLGKLPGILSSYRPITLLCCLFKLLERLILSRISPLDDAHILPEQARFLPQRSTTDQVLALNSFVEFGFEQKQKTGYIFIDLSFAYDTV